MFECLVTREWHCLKELGLGGVGLLDEMSMEEAPGDQAARALHDHMTDPAPRRSWIPRLRWGTQ